MMRQRDDDIAEHRFAPRNQLLRHDAAVYRRPD